MPTVAYSVAAPEAECAPCSVLVGGTGDSGGWVDAIGGDGDVLVPFLAPGDVSVQDIAVPGDHVIVVGSSSASDMRMLGHDRAGAALWAPKDLGKGRLRGVATDLYGSIYAVGRSDGEETDGLVFKFDRSGNLLDRDRLSQGADVSFTDIVMFRPGNGVIASQSADPGPGIGWLQVEFDCDLSEASCAPAEE
jgi:hypothetical protein